MMPIEFLSSLSGCLHGITVSHGLPLSMFFAGLVGGLGHCSFMCGPFVLSQTDSLTRMRDSLLIPYHAGRITTYALMAAFLSGVLNIAFLFLPIRGFVIAPMLILAGIIFLISAFPVAARIFPWAARIKVGVPYRILSGAVTKISGRKSALKQYSLGLLLGFMPCGLVLSALLAASTAPSSFQAGLAMAAFGAGTMPALIATALGGRALQAKYPRAMKRVTQGMMVWSGLWLFALAGMVLI